MSPCDDVFNYSPWPDGAIPFPLIQGRVEIWLRLLHILGVVARLVSFSARIQFIVPVHDRWRCCPRNPSVAQSDHLHSGREKESGTQWPGKAASRYVFLMFVVSSYVDMYVVCRYGCLYVPMYGCLPFCLLLLFSICCSVMCSFCLGVQVYFSWAMHESFMLLRSSCP